MKKLQLASCLAMFVTALAVAILLMIIIWEMTQPEPMGFTAYVDRWMMIFRGSEHFLSIYI